MTNRREFLKTAALAGSALSLGFTPRPAHPLRILILGGTSFLGPHQIAYALGRGHSVTIFTRGRTRPTVHQEVLDHVEHLTGDRADNLTALEGREWDAVIDNSGHNVDWARASADLLKDQVGLYMFTSSTGVYYPYLGDNITEDTVLETVERTPDEERDSWYGVMKTLSEREVRRAFGEERSIVVRPTYMIGPGDRTDRFMYWPARLERGGRVLVPGHAYDPVQFVDVRDVAEWMIRLIENQHAGTFNAVGPAARMGILECVHGIRAATSSPVEWVQVDDYDFLKQHGISYIVPWIMPTGMNYGSARVNFDRALAAGLTYRPLARTVLDSLDWWHSPSIPEERRENLVAAPDGVMSREASILEAWDAS